MPRNPVLSILTLLLVVLALGACGSDDDASTPTGATAGAEPGAFPARIEHKYGKTTIDSEPKRVVVAGLREQDALLALGVAPVATTEWYGKHPGAIFPWAKDELGDGRVPTVLSDEDGLDVEKIAAQRPDLIVAVYSGMTRKEYATLSKLAPVVAQPRGKVDYGSSWQEETLMTGTAVGQPERAQELVDETEGLIADAAAQHPEFEGQTAANVSDYQGVFVYGPQDERSRMLEQLGFEYPDALRDAFPDDFGGQLSEEKLDALDVGALLWFADGDRTAKELKREPLYSKLRVRKQARDVFVDSKDRVYEATSFPSVLSMSLLLKELVPRLAAAADGDPSTSTDERPDATEAASFPAKVTHKFGTTTVPERPQRIVSVGLTEQDIILELGYTPIAVTDWYGDQPHAVWPWAQERLGDAKPKVLRADDGFELEKIAALRPDLIVGVNSGMSRGDYEKLSKLAPTVAAGEGSTDYFSPWDQQVELVAAALGKPQAGRALVQGVEDAYAKVAAEHPEFEGKTASFSQNGFYDGQIYAYPDGLSTDFLTMLGFTINPKLTPLVQKRGEQVGISAERLDVLDADVIVFATEKQSDIAALKKVPTFNKLGAVAKRRAVYTDPTLAGALYFMTPLSLQYALERLTPQLEATVDGKAPQRIVD
jgi:iron complex transport system substrate-binding protein